MKAYLVATTKRWNIKNFEKISKEIGAKWHLITDNKDLTFKRIKLINPRYVFFPHWSWIIPEEIYSNFECIVFHMTDLPFGRGGSPLQNLILRGIYETKVSAIKAVKELDAGPVYLKSSLSLKGSAEEILIRCSDIIFDMIRHIIADEPSPVEQKGKPIIFKRRTPQESSIPDVKDDLSKIYDYIRMLDAEGYPTAFMETKNLRIEFSKAILKKDYILANVKITRRSEKNG